MRFRQIFESPPLMLFTRPSTATVMEASTPLYCAPVPPPVPKPSLVLPFSVSRLTNPSSEITKSSSLNEENQVEGYTVASSEGLQGDPNGIEVTVTVIEERNNIEVLESKLQQLDNEVSVEEKNKLESFSENEEKQESQATVKEHFEYQLQQLGNGEEKVVEEQNESVSDGIESQFILGEPVEYQLQQLNDEEGKVEELNGGENKGEENKLESAAQVDEIQESQIMVTEAVEPENKESPINMGNITNHILHYIASSMCRCPILNYQNLPTNDYLKCHMDEQDWVHVGLIAEFPRLSLCHRSKAFREFDFLLTRSGDASRGGRILRNLQHHVLNSTLTGGPHQVMSLHLKLNTLRNESVPKVFMF
ncbi:hypothetical protein HHK36_007768 [Tetracentron sinense]|uniref:Uncharacterized protein n=1 Tax=Tetracentron sinense TaxID=13715 RepID=A0A835DJD8_TETSI|nr:hypothetical protein HHK36_007768 [Tetracentron sinense]